MFVIVPWDKNYVLCRLKLHKKILFYIYEQNDRVDTFEIQS